jgi:hypothetical protein
MNMNVITKLFLFVTVHSYDVIGWFVKDADTRMNYTNVPYKYYTDIVTSCPVILDNGTAVCNKSDTYLKNFVSEAHKNNVSFVWRDGMTAQNLRNVIFNSSWLQYRNNYINSINKAMQDCDIDGLETDFEFEIGFCTHNQAVVYTEFLRSIKLKLPPNKTVGACMGVYGMSEGSFPLMTTPWLDPDMVNNGAIDYINMMSYHWPNSGDITPWDYDIYYYVEKWGFNPAMLNLGVPYFNLNGSLSRGGNEPLWRDLSDKCPNMDPTLSFCDGITVVNKEQNYQIGYSAKCSGFRGVFPWAANFDSLQHDNLLVSWLYAGLHT